MLRRKPSRREQVTHLTVTLSNDAWGQPAEVFAAAGTYDARVMTGRAREFVSGARDTAERRVSLLMDYVTAFAPQDRIIWQGDMYEIVGVTPRYSDNETQIDAVWVETMPGAPE